MDINIILQVLRRSMLIGGVVTAGCGVLLAAGMSGLTMRNGGWRSE